MNSGIERFKIANKLIYNKYITVAWNLMVLFLVLYSRVSSAIAVTFQQTNPRRYSFSVSGNAELRESWRKALLYP